MSTTRNFFSYTVAMADDTIVIAGDASHGTILTTLAGVTWNVSSLNADGSVLDPSVAVKDSRQNGVNVIKTTDYTGLIEFWAEPGEYQVTITDPQSRVGTKVIYWSSVSGQAGAIPGTTISNDEKIVSNQIAASAIGTEEIAASAVTTAKIADGTIVNADLSSAAAIAYSKLALTNSISTNDFVASGVTTHKIVASGITTDRINDGAVTTDKIAASGVTTAKIAASGVTTDRINNLAVTTDKIAAGAVTPAKLATAAWTLYITTVDKVTIGNGTIAARYQRIQNTVFLRALVTTGTLTTVAAGTLALNLPYAPVTTGGGILGSWEGHTASDNTRYNGHCIATGAGRASFRVSGYSAGNQGIMTDNYPWVYDAGAIPWGYLAGDTLEISLCYEVA